MTINCRGKLVDLSVPKIMGILNLTPDSFYDGGKYNSLKNSIKKTHNMIKSGASFIDIGGQSTRPGGNKISIKEEEKRLFPIVESLLKEFPNTIFSIDTFHHSIAFRCLEMGVSIVNDISGGYYDPKIIKIAGEKKAPYVLTYNEINPLIIDNDVNFKNIVQKGLFYFSSKIKEGYKNGLNDIIIDPGFGFSKTIEKDYFILKNLEFFKMLELPILVGLSRKSMIYKKLKISPEKGLNGTSVLNSIALLKGANILRVHDVIEAKECIDLLQSLQ